MLWCFMLVFIYSSNNKQASATTMLLNTGVSDFDTNTQQTDIEDKELANIDEDRVTNGPPEKKTTTNVTIQTNRTTERVNITDNTNTSKPKLTIAKELSELLKMIDNIQQRVNKTQDVTVINSANTKINQNTNDDNETVRYQDVDHHNNVRIIVMKSRRDMEEFRLRKFLVSFYNSTLHVLNKLRSQLDKQDLMEFAIDLFKGQYKEHINNISIVNNHLDNVIVVLDTIDHVKSFKDKLIAFAFIKASEVDTALRIQTYFDAEFDKLLNEENEYVCKEFGVCRSVDSFSNFVTGLCDVIIKGGGPKALIAMKALLALEYPDTDFTKDLSTTSAKETFSLKFWNALHKKFKDPNGLLEGMKVSDLNKQYPATPANVAAWKKITSDMESFVVVKAPLKTLNQYLKNLMI